MRFQINVGHEFPIDATGESNVVTNHESLLLRVRAHIAFTILIVIFLFLTSATIFGLVKDNFSALQSVWQITAAPLGMILAHYFPNSS